MSLLTLADLSPDIWLDASDSSTVTLSGSNVTALADKSGNSRNTTNTSGTNLPTYANAQINGLNALQHSNSAAQFLNFTDLNYGRNVSAMTIFAIVQRTGGNATFGTPLVLGSGVAGSDRAGIYTGTTLARTGGRRLDANAFQEVTASYTAASVNLIGGVFDYANASLTIDINGTLAPRSGGYQTAGNTSDTASLGSRIGAATSTGFFFGGYFCEAFVAARILTTLERQQLEGSLLWKWGAQARLPNDHPFKNAAPMNSSPVTTFAAAHNAVRGAL